MKNGRVKPTPKQTTTPRNSEFEYVTRTYKFQNILYEVLKCNRGQKKKSTSLKKRKKKNKLISLPLPNTELLQQRRSRALMPLRCHQHLS